MGEDADADEGDINSAFGFNPLLTAEIWGP